MSDVLLRLTWEEAVDLLAEMGRERDGDMQHYAPQRLRLRRQLRARLLLQPDEERLGVQEMEGPNG